MDYLILIILGILPGLIWLSYFLRKDNHPESSRVIIKIFLLGILASIPTLFFEINLSNFLSFLLPEKNILYNILYFFIVIALTEEIIKYLVVKYKALSDPEFDEPVDIMIYMIIAALGFATVENISYLFFLNIKEAIFLTSCRFIGAILLHASSSAIFGYFIALSFFKTKERKKLFILGLLSATTLHGFFNFSIMILSEKISIFGLIIPLIILSFLMFFISKSFKKLNKLKSISLLETEKQK